MDARERTNDPDAARAAAGAGAHALLVSLGRRVVVASHRRSGTHLVIDFLRRQFPVTSGAKRLGEPLNRVYLTLELLERKGRDSIDEAEAARILARARRPIVKTHGLPGRESGVARTPFVEAVLAEADFFYVYRDGRDVLSSLHLYMQSYAPEARVEISEFLRQEVDGSTRVSHWARHYRAWRSQPGVALIAFESLLDDPERVIERIHRTIGQRALWRDPLLPKPLRSKWHGRALRLLARRPAATTILGRPGGRKPLDWRRTFSRADREFFERESDGLLVELGYEDSSAWVDAPRRADDEDE